MSLRDKLLAAAAAYCAEHDISKAALGDWVMNDNKFFTRIEGGGGFTVRTYERFMTAFEGPPPRKSQNTASEVAA